MLCIPWSAISWRPSTVTACGTSRSGTSVRVAVDVRDTAYPARRASAVTTTGASRRAESRGVPVPDEAESRAGSGDDWAAAAPETTAQAARTRMVIDRMVSGGRYGQVGAFENGSHLPT